MIGPMTAEEAEEAEIREHQLTIEARHETWLEERYDNGRDSEEGLPWQ